MVGNSSVAPSASRTAVVAAALQLFDEHGFEVTSVDQIARAAGISRSTFFRHFGSKDDVIFADHDAILTTLAHDLERSTGNPWRAVCAASVTVFRTLTSDADLARQRYRMIRQVPTLREREIVAESKYTRLFVAHLTERVPGVDALDAVAFAASVTATHNHVLRTWVRASGRASVASLTRANTALLRRFGVADAAAEPHPDDVVVAAFPRNMPAAELARRVRDALADGP